MGLGDGVFERNNACGAAFGIVEAGEPQHGGDVRCVFRANLLHVLAVAEVVVAAGQFQATLHADRACNGPSR